MTTDAGVNEAIWKGRLTVTLPVVATSLGVICTSFYLASIGFGVNIIGMYTVCVPVIAICYGRMAARWYIWAFSNVRNVHELRQRAIFERLMLNRNSIFFKINVIPKAKQEIIASLEKKFDVPDEFNDDCKIPPVTKIYFAKTMRLFMMIVMLVCFAAGIALLSIAHLYIVGSILCVISGCLIFDAYQRISNDQPQIIISNDGIETITSGFHNWNEIKNELVGIEGGTDYDRRADENSPENTYYGRGTYYYLSYDFHEGKEKIPIYELRVNHWKLAKLLRVYRSRSM